MAHQNGISSLNRMFSKPAVSIMDFIAVLEEHLGRKARMNFLPLQAGDVPETFADVEDLVADVGFKPATPLAEGIRRFVTWYRDYYRC